MIDQLLVKPGQPAGLGVRDPGDRLGLDDKDEAATERDALLEQLHELQDRFWAEATRSVLLVLQGMDSSGKDGTIEHVFHGMDPQGVRAAAFKVPTAHELAHDYLWRVHDRCPARGEIGIFNRSHYEDLVTVRVLGLVSPEACRKRYRHVQEFERMLTDEGTAIVKVFLHISKEKQAERLQARLDDPDKRWKFRAHDLETRKRWDDYMAYYEEVLTETSTEWAPWYVVPADRKWVRNVTVARLLVDTLESLEPRFPEPEEDLSGIVIE